ncbi:MAG: 3-deoxy-manno-octulosonate cytidylyltransferase [Ferruginibacter sp.]|nr:3-deoxy-manno-octulosonate cytidylyltransferase [Ferruginibacter sp.]
MKTIAMIPARYAATRFPFKLMQPLGSKTVIRHTYDNTVATDLFDDVFVVTDHKIIYDEITTNGGKAIMSIREHESGSDRIAEAIADMEVDIVLNVQGDEPFVNAHMLKKLLDVFKDDVERKIKVASPVKKILNPAHAANHNIVKVVVDKHMNSLLFSRSVIPFYRDETTIPFYYEHIGVYAFRKEALLLFTVWEMTPLEKAEKIECLRYLEHGIQLRMVETEDAGVKIDMPEDLAKAEAFLKNML